MVKEIDANNALRSVFARAEGIQQGKRYRVVSFTRDEVQSEAEYLAKLKTYPDLYERATLYRNVFDQPTGVINLIVVPKDSPYFGKERKYPNENMTYIVRATKPHGRDKEPKVFLVLDGNPTSAEMYGRALVETAIKSRNFDVETIKVTAEEFIKEGRRLIDRGVNLPRSILIYGDLSEYQYRKEHGLTAA